MNTIKKISAVLSHLSIILSLCFLTFTVLDWYNPKMAFRTNPISSKLLVVFCVAAMLSSVSNLLLSSKSDFPLRHEKKSSNSV